MQYFRNDNTKNIISSLSGCDETQTVKQNSEREVTLIDNVYIKHDRPKNLFRRLRNILRQKVKVEYDIAVKLEAAGVPVVKMLGYMQQGSSGKLFSLAEPGAQNAGEYWFGPDARNRNDSGFCSALAKLIKKIFAAGFYHSDFHFGNLLYVAKTGKMLLVDPYEAKKVQVLTDKQKLKMLDILAELRNRITDREAAQLVVDCGYKHDIHDATALWHEILRRAYRKARRSWKKRSRQLLADYKKYVEVVKAENKLLRIRKLPFAAAALDPQALAAQVTENTLSKQELPEDEAQQLWIKSCFIEYLGFRCQRCLAWEKHDGKDFIYIEKLQKLSCENCDRSILAEFMNHAALAKLNITTADLLQTADSEIALRLK